MPPQSRRTFAATAVALPLLLSPLTTFSAHAAENPATPPSSPVPPPPPQRDSSPLTGARNPRNLPRKIRAQVRKGASSPLSSNWRRAPAACPGTSASSVPAAKRVTRPSKTPLLRPSATLTHGQEESSDVADYFHALDDAAGRMRPAASRCDIETV